MTTFPPGLAGQRLVGTATLTVALITAGCSASTPRPAPSPSSTASPRAQSHVAAAGTVLAAGDDASGQLGISTGAGGWGIVDTLQPVAGVGGHGVLTGVRALAGGGRHSLAVREDGTVVSWGANDDGQLGIGTLTPATYPTPVKAPDGKPGLLSDVVSVSADSNFSLALLGSGEVVTFGSGNRGQRGIGRVGAPLTPTTVLGVSGSSPLRDVRAISADGSTELALLGDGTLVGWGANNDGQLGDGTTRDHARPVHVRGAGGSGLLGRVTAIALGGHNALAVLIDGSVLSWGGNDHGQLGDGTTRPHPFPAPVHGVDGAGLLTGATQVSAAEKHGFARLRDGRVVGWGFGNAGQLGNNGTSDKAVPTLVLDPSGTSPLTGVAHICAGEAYAVAILDDGTALSWGAASAGQLGDGDRRARALPGALDYRGLPPARVRIIGAGVRHLLLSADP